MESVNIILYVNGTLKGNVTTNEQGIASLTLNYDFTDQLRLNLSANVLSSGSGFLYDPQNITTVLIFNKVSVHDVMSNGTGQFELGYHISCANESSNTAYIGVNNTIEIEANIFNLPVENAPVSFVVAKNLTRAQTSYANATN